MKLLMFNVILMAFAFAIREKFPPTSRQYRSVTGLIWANLIACFLIIIIAQQQKNESLVVDSQDKTSPSGQLRAEKEK